MDREYRLLLSQSQKERDNLARIRENQRRSRARRKEYLSELEDKWRQCEQTGVEATAEVQSAARLVLDENKRLRALLRLKGVSDIEMDAFELNGASNGGTYDTIPASLSLETILRSRKSCGSCGTSTSGQQSSLSSTSNSQGLSNLRQSSSLLQAPQSCAGRSNGSDPSELTQYPPRSSWANDGPVANLLPQSNPVSTHQHVAPSLTTDFGLLSTWEQEGASTTIPATSSTSCSCAEAIDMIHGMGGHVDSGLRRDLGCNENEPQCRASTSLVFEMLDRYQNSGIGS